MDPQKSKQLMELELMKQTVVFEFHANIGKILMHYLLLVQDF